MGLLLGVPAVAGNVPPVQTFYIPVPEDDYLTVLNAIEDGQTWIPANLTPVDPIYTYATISVFSDNTIIYYDQWENDFDATISDPLNIYNPTTNLGGTQIWGDDDTSNGSPPGFAQDILNFGTVIRLENSVVSTNRTVINFDGGDKIASTKPIALTWAGWASGSKTLFAGANEVFDTTFWGIDYQVPAGEDIATDITNGIGEIFQYVGLSIMAGADDTTIEIDADADGTYETTNTLAEGEAYLQDGGISVGARVQSDKPVQIDMIAGDVYDGYETRFFRLLPIEYWSQSSTTPVSTPNTQNEQTTVWLYNPATNSIDVLYQTRPGGSLSTTNLTVPGGSAGGYLRQVIPNGYGARFINTNDSPFYSLATIDSTGTATSPTTGPGDNRTWDWGFTLVPEESLTRQVLVGLGIGRDPTSSVNPNENGAPIWVTPVGNGDTNVTIYVDYDSDPSTGPFQDPNSNYYDVAFTARELDILKIYKTNSTDQSGMLIYLLDANVKLAAAWGSDPLTATPGQPGLDMGTGIPPLPEFVANKRSFLLIDEDSDGYVSPGDLLQYRIIIDNTGRQPVTDLVAEDLLPSSLTYITNTTFFVSSAGVTNAIADDTLPATPFPLDNGGYTITNESALPVGGTWEISYDTRVADFTNLPPGTIDLANQAVVGGVGLVSSNVVTTPLYARVGDFVWWDVDGDGYQSGSETGINGVVVSLQTTNGTAVLNDVGAPITTVTTNDSMGTPGWYQLTGVLAGTYMVKFEPPTGYIFTTPDADANGPTGSTNSNASIPNGLSSSFSIDAGETVSTIDAGLVEDSTIGDFVWWDADADGLQDAGERGINGVTVNLLDNSGDPVLDADSNPISVVTTNDGSGDPGYYIFEGLYPDNYIVEFVLLTNAIFTAQNADSQGSGGSANSDADTTTGRTDVITLGVEEALTSIDAGMLRADLVLTKVASQSTTAEGATLSYTVAISNAGPTRATGVTASEPLTNGITYVTNSVSQGSYNSGSGVWTVGTLATGAVATLTLDVTVDGGTKGTSITNMSQITASDVPDPDSTNDQDDEIIYVSGLLITKTSDVGVSVVPGETITYTIVVTNDGAATHNDVVISDPIPDGTAFVSNSVVATLTPPATSPGSTTLVYSADDTFVVPTGVTNIRVKAWGAGGGGGGGGSNHPGAAGGGGAFAEAVLTVTPAESITVNVGGAGGLGTSDATGGDGGGGGGLSAVLRTTNALVIAAGGGGGGGGDNSNANSDSSGGAGGVVVGIAGGDASAATTGGGGGSGSGGGAAGASGNTAGEAGSASQGGGGGGGNTGSTGDRSPSNAGANGGGNAGEGAGGYGAGGGGGSGYFGGGGGGGATANEAGGGGGGGGSSYVTGTQTNRMAGSGSTAANTGDADYVAGTGNGGSGGSAGASGTNGEGGLVVITYTVPIVAGVTNSPPTLTSGWQLVPGQTLTVTFDVLVDDPLALMAITNTATVDSDLLPTPLPATVIDPLVPVDLGIGKTASPPVVNEGDPVLFTLSLTNLSELSEATGVEVTDALPAGFSFVSAVPSAGSYNSTSGIWTVGTVATQAVETLTLNVTATNGSAGFYWTNITTITASDQFDQNPSNDTAQAVVLVRGADLELIKTVDNPTPNEGSQITYTITVENLGPSDTTGVTVSEPLTNGVVYVTNSTSQGSYNSTFGVWTVGALGTGDVATLTITADVGVGTVGTSITNISQITGNDLPDPNPTNNLDTASIAVSGLRVTKTSDVTTYAYPGSNVTYTIVVTNLGTTAQTGITVSDVIPTGTTYVPGSLTLSDVGSVTNTVRDEFNAIAFTNNDGTVDWSNDWQDPEDGDPNGNPVRVQTFWGTNYQFKIYNSAAIGWRAVDLAGATQANLTFDYRIVGLDTVGEDCGLYVSTNNGATLTQLMFFQGIRANDTVTQTTNINLTPYISTNTSIWFTNSVGMSGGSGWQTDDIQIKFITPIGTAGTPPDLATVDTLQPGDAFTITYSVTVDDPASVTQVVNTVAVDSDQVLVPIMATVEDPVPFTDLGVTKAVDTPQPNEADTIVWTVTVTNNGPADTTGVEVTDVLPSGVTYVTNSPSVGSYASGSGIWTVGDLNVGTSETITLTATVDTGTAGSFITNTATITGNDFSDPNPTNDHDDATIQVVSVDIGVGKSVNPTVPFEREQLTYTVTVTNLGPSSATGVEVTDSLPAALTYVSHTASQGSYVPGSGVWTIGNMSLLQVETLTLVASVPGGTSGQSITNVADVTGVDQIDTNALNDTASVVVLPEKPPLLITKASDATRALGPGDTITYTIAVSNRSTQTQTGIDVTDPVPEGLSFVPSSVSIFSPVNTNAQFLDTFPVQSFSNDNGELSWPTNWVESEADGAISGDTRVWTDSGRAAFTLKFGGGSKTLDREVDLSSYTNATLSLVYRRDGLIDAGDFVELQASSNGAGGTFTTITTYAGPATDSSYGNTSVDITSYISTNTTIRFSSPAGNTPGNVVWFDDVAITVPIRTNATLAGGTPPTLVSDWTLEPSEALTVTYQMTVDSPVPLTQLCNEATAQSDQMTNSVSASVCDPVDALYLAGVGDRIWLDENGDGIQDAGEDGIANVGVEVLDTNSTVVAATVTDTEGNYLVTGLVPGSYTVRVVTNSLAAGLLANQTFDPDGTTNHQTSVTLAMGEVFRDADFGYNWSDLTTVGAIGDRVWIDADGDGVQDPGEGGLDGVTVTLYTDDSSNGVYDAVYATTTTDAAGNYIFDDLPAGAYAVGVIAPVGYTQTGDPDDFGTVASSPDNRTTTPVILAPGDVFVNADFGYEPSTSSDLSGTVYLDTDANDNLDGIDYGIERVSVALLDASGNVIATTRTDTNGFYAFTGLPAGTYTAWVNDTDDLLNDLTQTEDQDATKDGRHQVTLNGSTDVTGIDFGYTPESHTTGAGLIGDRIWLDLDGDGTQDAGEPGLEGVTVELYDNAGTNLLDEAKTDANGNYTFGGLSTNDTTYIVRIDTNSLPASGAELTNTGDPDGGTANEASLTLTGASPIRVDQDFGYQASVPNTIAGTIWEDGNADGILTDGSGSTANETNSGLAGVTVTLHDSNGSAVGTTVTDVNGDYQFTGLPDGSYSVDVTDADNVLAGWWHTDGPSPGSDTNSQADPYSVSVSGGQTNTTADFGYYVRFASIGDLVWLDNNQDGLQNAGETNGVAGTRVTLLITYSGGITTLVHTVSDSSGFYSIGGLDAGDYTVHFTPPNEHWFTAPEVGADPTIDSNPDPTNGLYAIIGLVQGSTNLTIDAGLIYIPTLARIISFRAYMQAGEAIVEWRVAEEINTAYYSLSKLADGTYQPVSASPVPAVGTVRGPATYTQVDTGALPHGTYTYLLIETEIYGTTRQLGPYTITINAPTLSLDEWSRAVFTPAQLSDPAITAADADPDMDGHSNMEEFYAGTAPMDRDSTLRIQNVDAPGSNLIRITWASVAGHTYTVRMSTTGPQGFVPLASGIAATPPQNQLLIEKPAHARVLLQVCVSPETASQ